VSEPSGSPRRGRAIVAGGAALVVLGAAVLLLSSGGGRDAALTADFPARDGAATVPATGAAGAPGGAGAIVPASAPVAATEPADPAAAGPRSWSDVPVAARLSDLGPLAPDVYKGLQRARAALEGCYQADARNEAAHPRAQDREAWGAAVVTLELEGRPGELVIVGAPLQELGTSAMSLVDCSEGVLRGFRIPAAAAVPGKRYRLQHQLTP
jgi:hypothetical protein